jgi:hypothetical protein
MWDIFLGGLLVVAISSAAFAAGLGIARHAPRAVSDAFGAVVLLFIFWFATGIYGTLAMARLLPFASVIVVGNWIPVGAALLAGLLVGQRKAAFGYHMVFVMVLLSLAWYTLFLPLGKARLAGTDKWSVDRVCLQTSPSSCSPCSACHAVVLYGLGPDNSAIIGDPASGRRIWTMERLKASWSGHGLRLVRRHA